MDFWQTYFSFVTTAEGWVALATLVAMEVVLGIDNLIFISILSNKLPEEHRAQGAAAGHRRGAHHAAGAAGHRLLHRRSSPSRCSRVVGQGFSWRDLILLAGGLFLVWKATKEIHHTVDPDDGKENIVGDAATLTVGGAIFQILLLDLVFSVDSIITAVGMTDQIAIMYIAVIVAVVVMLVAADPLAHFIEANPTIVMLALGFLLMIGMTLIAEAFGFHVPQGYVYAAMGFSTLVEVLNMLAQAGAAKKAGGGQALTRFHSSRCPALGEKVRS